MTLFGKGVIVTVMVKIGSLRWDHSRVEWAPKSIWLMSSWKGEIWADAHRANTILDNKETRMMFLEHRILKITSKPPEARGQPRKASSHSTFACSAILPTPWWQTSSLQTCETSFCCLRHTVCGALLQEVNMQGEVLEVQGSYHREESWFLYTNYCALVPSCLVC
jgi:hypothetical protein